MPPTQDAIDAVPEAKSLRKDLRLKPSVMAAIERAALAVGMDTSTFITSAAYRDALAVEAAQHRTVLPQEAFDAFAEVVNRPGERLDSLKDLMKARQSLQSDG